MNLSEKQNVLRCDASHLTSMALYTQVMSQIFLHKVSHKVNYTECRLTHPRNTDNYTQIVSKTSTQTSESEPAIENILIIDLTS